MKVLVTGGAGFIGSHIVEHFQGNADVKVLDNLRSGFQRNLEGFRCEFIQGSILDRGLVRQAVAGVDYVFHLAALISVPESMENPIECTEINTIGTLIVLEEAARAKVKKLVLSTSAAVYGDNPVMPKVETMTPEPKSPYAITKLDGEYYCRMFAETGCLPTVCLRYFNVFGPRQDPKSQYAAAVPIFIDRALRGAPITIFGDGEQTRDFVYVKDVVRANVHAATNPAMDGVYNVAYGKKISINDLVQMIRDITGSNSTVEYLPERAGDIKHSMASVERLLSTGFIPTGSLSDGLKVTVNSR
ncbi:MAG: SDR family oxidoreductase [Kiritimatiellae bacterium]|nr:SDR family oxidoreductase [Kiritimatiellia bacterium]MDD5521419.1 SDR family oxidoreductase [Kiritimatiellia bacterium]